MTHATGAAGFSNEEVVTLVVVGLSSAVLGFILQLTAYEQADRDKREQRARSADCF